MSFKSIISAISRRKGQASLEVLAAFVPWFLMTILYFNLIFMFSSLLIAQSSVNRAALQAAAAGCLGEGVADEMSTSIGFGSDNVEVYAATTQNRLGEPAPLAPWGSFSSPSKNKSDYIHTSGDETGVPIEDKTKSIICNFDDPSPRVAEYGHVIYVAAVYDQQFFLFGDQRIVRSATVISQQREGLTG